MNEIILPEEVKLRSKPNAITNFLWEVTKILGIACIIVALVYLIAYGPSFLKLFFCRLEDGAWQCF